MKTRIALVTAVLALGVSTPAVAHNHLINPSGYCNQSGDGLSPGKSGETNLNPAGKPVGQAKADNPQDTGPARGDNNCKNSLRVL